MWRDLALGLRILRGNRTFAAAAILTLALAIGANTAIFSAVHAVLLRPLPYRDSSRLVAIWGRHAKQPGFSKVFDSYGDFRRWRESARSFETIAVATWGRGGAVLTGRGPARQVLPVPVSAEFFAMLGVGTERGRVFDAVDTGRGCSVVLAHRFWRDALGSDQKTVGASLTLDKASCEVVGVMPASFSFYPAATDLWTLIPPGHPETSAAGVFARLRDGVSLEEAERELSALHERDKASLTADRADIVPAVYPLRDEFTWLTSRTLRTTLIVLLAMVAALLAIACANVASLLMGRCAGREREMAIRAALGAGRARLIRQMLAEGLTLAACGAAAGLALSAATLRMFRVWHPVELPPGVNLSLSWPVLAFSLVLTAGAAIAFSLVPAWRAAGVSLRVSAIRGRSGGALVAFEVALASALCMAAWLLVASSLRLQGAPAGFDIARIAWVSASSNDAEESRTFEHIAQRIAALPGVESAALTSHLPLQGFAASTVTVEGSETAEPPIDTLNQRVSAPYFQTMGLPLLRGRLLTESDPVHVAVVSKAFAERRFAGRDPIGRRFRFGRPADKAQWIEIVGVVGDENRTHLEEMSWVHAPVAYRRMAQGEARSAHIVVRSTDARTAWAGALPAILREVAPNTPVSAVQTMLDLRDKTLAYPRFRAAMVLAFGGAALLLAVAGVYAVVSRNTASRTREFGVRLAVGARPASLAALVMKQGMAPVAIGLAAGVLGAWWWSRALSAILAARVTPDALTTAAVPMALLIASAAAILIPARRAARMDPVAALRSE